MLGLLRDEERSWCVVVEDGLCWKLERLECKEFLNSSKFCAATVVLPLEVDECLDEEAIGIGGWDASGTDEKADCGEYGGMGAASYSS